MEQESPEGHGNKQRERSQNTNTYLKSLDSGEA